MKILIEINGSRGTSSKCFSKVFITTKNGEYSSELCIDGRTLYYGLGPPSGAELDLLLVCSIIYGVDKLIPRDTASDGWQRHLCLELPVKNVTQWNASKECLESCLRFLTGDLWEISFVARTVRLFHPMKRRTKAAKKILIPNLFVSHATLLSGGLDSLIGVINLLYNEKHGIMTISHHDKSGGDLAAQNRILDLISPKYPKRLYPLKVYIALTDSNENSSRSRSLLFLGLACYAALRKGINSVIMPENGMIALNIPLTASRRGSCSTRTAHPGFVRKFNDLLLSLELDVKVSNPYIAMTKGQMVDKCKNQQLLSETIQSTVSCGKVGRFRTWALRTEDVRGCGCCIPCLYRRASTHVIGGDSELYGRDVCVGEVDIASGKKHTFDFRDLLSFLKQELSPADIRRKILFTGQIQDNEVEALTKMVMAAREESLSWLRDKSSAEQLRLWGL